MTTWTCATRRPAPIGISGFTFLPHCASLEDPGRCSGWVEYRAPGPQENLRSILAVHVYYSHAPKGARLDYVFDAQPPGSADLTAG